MTPLMFMLALEGIRNLLGENELFDLLEHLYGYSIPDIAMSN